jgi:purine-cytosine permease-like protein
MALFNVFTCIGWSVINVIVGGQLVQALSGGRTGSAVGILAITLLTMLVSLYGYRYVHRYQRVAWMPMMLVFVGIAVVNVPQATVVTAKISGSAYVAALLSFGSAIYGASAGWTPYAADYSVKQPETTPAFKVFALTFLGIWIPCVLLEALGVLLTTIPVFDGKSGGELLTTALSPLSGLGTVMLLFLALSVVANNIPNDYSMGLSIQVLGGVFQRIKRWKWTLVGSVLYAIIAIAADDHFNQTLEHFLLVIAYWLSPWAAILAIEHGLRRGRYNVEDWNDPARLPLGWAAIAAMSLGLVGVYLGAAQVMFVGPIAYQLNPPFGMDIGFELGGLFAAIAYLIMRPIERRITQR